MAEKLRHSETLFRMGNEISPVALSYCDFAQPLASPRLSRRARPCPKKNGTAAPETVPTLTDV